MGERRRHCRVVAGAQVSGCRRSGPPVRAPLFIGRAITSISFTAVATSPASSTRSGGHIILWTAVIKNLYLVPLYLCSTQLIYTHAMSLRNLQSIVVSRFR